MRGEFVELGGERLYYFAAGSRGKGGPVVFVHGFPTTSHLWHEVVPLVPAGRRLVVLDQLGCGRSVAPAGADLGIPAQARRVGRLMDALGIERATMVAHGVGALASLDVLRQWPGRISDLILVNPARPAAPLEGWGTLPWLGSLVRWAAPSVGASLLHGAIVKRFIDRARAIHSADLYARSFAGSGGRDILAGHLHALTIAPHPPDMGERPPRASIVYGRDSRRDRRTAAAFATALPGATLHEVTAAGHFLPEEAPEQLARLIAMHLGS
jgi:pimeloyl-ACP methyl ester carboxylesterase